MSGGAGFTVGEQWSWRPGADLGKLQWQVDRLGQSILPGERVVVPGYHVGQAALLGGAGVHALLLEGSCMWAVYIAR